MPNGGCCLYITDVGFSGEQEARLLKKYAQWRDAKTSNRFNPRITLGHIGERPALLPLHHPSSPTEPKKITSLQMKVHNPFIIHSPNEYIIYLEKSSAD